MTATLGAMMSTSVTVAANSGNGYVELVEVVSPAVVFVKVTASVQMAGAEAHPMDDPRFEEFMKRFGGEMPQQDRSTPQQGVGSGFIISDDGLIVTNHHVINGAAQVTIKMADGEEYDASIIGSDPLTDIALLNIEGEDFPTVSFGSSDELRVGEEVITVGSPFGLGSKVISGIISAKLQNPATLTSALSMTTYKPMLLSIVETQVARGSTWTAKLLV